MPEPFYATESFYGTLNQYRYEVDIHDCEVIVLITVQY